MDEKLVYPGLWTKSKIVLVDGTILLDHQKGVFTMIKGYEPYGVIVSYVRELGSELCEPYEEVFIPYAQIKSISEMV